MAATAKFNVGDKVKHPASSDGSHPAGTGTVASVIPDTGDGVSYKVKCDADGHVLSNSFKETELTKVS